MAPGETGASNRAEGAPAVGANSERTWRQAAHTRVAVGYNVQVAVDARHKLIVEQQVTNQVVDMGLLTQTAEPAKEVPGVEKIEVVAEVAISKSRMSRPVRRQG